MSDIVTRIEQCFPSDKYEPHSIKVAVDPQILRDAANEIDNLRHKLFRYRQTFEGMKVIQECDDGSLILESHTGERRHVWQGCDEKAQREIDALTHKVSDQEDEIGRLRLMLSRETARAESGNNDAAIYKSLNDQSRAAARWLYLHHVDKHEAEAIIRDWPWLEEVSDE